MRSPLLCITMLLIPAVVAHAQAPDPLTIQAAMNESLELDYPFFQELVDVQVLLGGVTNDGDYLFLCTARLVWKLSSAEFTAFMQQQLDPTGTFSGVLAPSFLAKLSHVGTFQSGDTVTPVRFRVRLERAGVDWIVTTVKLRESSVNPLSILDR